MPGVNTTTHGAREQVSIWTDGSGQTGIGGWCAILRTDTGAELVLSGADVDTTNNRMEMMGAIQGLSALQRPCVVDLYSDSQYLIAGMSRYILGWRKRGWITRAGEIVANRDLWEALTAAAKPHSVTWHWIRGHDGHPENERCDMHARRARLGLPRIIRHG